MSKENIIKNIKEIFNGGYVYNIPEYQRGYKWSESQVRTLLEDIDNFSNKNSPEQFYCLQHLTIKKNSNLYYDVIDGQQRLTTIFILLSYLKETSLLEYGKEYKIKYSIREESQKDLYFILELASKQDFKFITKDFREKSQDTYHFCLALDTIRDFFSDIENPEEFKKKLLNDVRIIVNDLSKSKISNEIIFRNLNINKIALKDYDFIRAIFVTKVDNKTKVDIKLKRIKIASSIDDINMWWSRKDVSSYFYNICSENCDKNIYILYYLYHKAKKLENDSLFKYLNQNTSNSYSIFDDVLLFHNTMTSWYYDKLIYHLLGFIFRYIKKINYQNNNVDIIVLIWENWNKSNTYYDFIKYLKGIIKEHIKELYDENNQLNIDINKSFYGYNNSLTIKILVLMDIIKIINNDNLSYLDSNNFDRNNEDIEHIFSKTPNNESTVEEAKNNINNILFLLERENEDYEDLKDFYNQLQNYEEGKTLLKDLDLLDLYKNKIINIQYINSIGNLVLLHSSINRGYKNYSFMDKRSTIIKEYNRIRNHTWTIFTKSFISESNDLDEWKLDDIKKSTEYIKKELEKFFFNISLGDKK